ncbi:MAG: AAA family ATPase, partial [Chloroflexi bacterium]|nr:AAA family ATPase [Chloroflexota bacterium]
MPAVHAITVRGFKSIAALENLELRAINILIGANGSGKSNFLGVFSFLHAVREGRLRYYVIQAGGADKVLHFGAKVTSRLEIRAEFEEGTYRYETSFSTTGYDQLYTVGEAVSLWNIQRIPNGLLSSKALTPVGTEAALSDPRVSGIEKKVRDRVGDWRVYHFQDTSANSQLKTTADLNDNRYLHPDGGNLAAFLYLLRERHNVCYERIRRTIQQVAPFFDDFLLEPQRLNPDKIRLEWRHRDSDAYFDVSSLSDGTLRFIALATLFLQPEADRPSVILVDEPELGLHPYAVSLLAALIQKAAVTTQVIVSTQSPLLLDYFEP